MPTNFPPLESLSRNRSFCHLPIWQWYESSRSLSTLDPVPYDRSILLVRPSSIGDVLWMTPVIREIKKQCPRIDIDVCTIQTELFENNPHVKRVLQFKQCDFSKKKNSIFEAYHGVYFLSYEFTPGVHPVECYSDIVGIQVGDYQPELFLTQQEIDKAMYLLENLEIGTKFCVLHKECAWKTKKWSDTQWKELVINLKKDNVFDEVIFVSQKHDKSFDSVARQICNRSLREIMAVIYHSSMVVAIDSGIMHIATALDKKLVSLFGITDPEKILPIKYVNSALQIQTEYAGCHYRQPNIPAEFEPKNVPLNLMDNIPVNMVEYTIKRLMKG